MIKSVKTDRLGYIPKTASFRRRRSVTKSASPATKHNKLVVQTNFPKTTKAPIPNFFLTQNRKASQIQIEFCIFFSSRSNKFDEIKISTMDGNEHNNHSNSSKTSETEKRRQNECLFVQWMDNSSLRSPSVQRNKIS